MYTVGAVYTAQAIVDNVSSAFAEIMPDCRLINIVDGGLVQDIIRDGKVTTGTARRVMHAYMSAVDAGADVILNTCSSVGDVVDHAQWFIPVNIVKIDAAMVRQAIGTGQRIAVLATLPTTLSPTIRLVNKEAADAGKTVEIVEGLADGAFQALVSGSPETHDSILLETAKKAASKADCIVLAQGSMARMEEAIAAESGKPVFSSIRSGIESIKALKEGLESTRA